MELSNREIASLFWTLLIAAAAFFYSPIGKVLWIFLKAVIRPPSLIYFGAASLYIATCILFLRWWGIWTSDNLKTTIGWIIAFALASMIKAGQIDEDRTFFGRTLKETVCITVLLVFILGLQSFNIGIELLIVPLVTFLTLLQGIAEKDERLVSAVRLFSAISTLIVLAIFAYSLYLTISDWPKFEVRKNLSELIVPVLLSLLFLPFLYWTSVILVYQRNFRSMDFALPTKGLIRFAKRRAIFAFGSNVRQLKRWRHIMMLRDGDDRLAIVQAIAQSKREDDLARRRPTIPEDEGWSPYEAVEFLGTETFAEPHYNWYPDNYRASATWKCDDGPLSSHMSYYVDGDERRATRLGLDLNVWNKDREETDEQHFVELVTLLLHKSVGPDGVAALREVLIPGETSASLDWNGYRFRIRTTHHGNSDRYSVRFVIAHPADCDARGYDDLDPDP